MKSKKPIYHYQGKCRVCGHIDEFEYNGLVFGYDDFKSRLKQAYETFYGHCSECLEDDVLFDLVKVYIKSEGPMFW